MRFVTGSLLVLALMGGAAVAGLGDTHPAPASVAAEYSHDIRPLMQQHCLGCHSSQRHAGALDLERFTTLAEARRAPAAWVKVAEMLGNGEMPPKSARPLTPAQRQRLIAWVKRYLDAEALASAGDPGPVVLRRLNNAEYTYTIRDLTGVNLDPAREFPADNAAGEGFTNAGGAMVMSPAMLTKYFDAGKEIARHAELLPDGFRFSPDTARNDWTSTLLAQIRALYAKYSESGGASTINLQGVVFKENDGGRLPVEKYLLATLQDRKALQAGDFTAVALKRGLNAKYLGILWGVLQDGKPSPLLDAVRARWRQAAPEDAPALAAFISGWQTALFRFTTVGRIGREDGAKNWQEPVVPLAARQETRLKLPDSPDGKPVSLYLATRDAGDGKADDYAIWEQPRLAAPGRPDLPLRDIREFTREMTARRERMFASAAAALEAADTVSRAPNTPDVAQLAREHQVDPDSLSAWLDYLGIGSNAPLKLAHFSHQETNATYPFIQGWSSPDLPMVVTNSSNRHVRIPGNMKPHGVCVHPTPDLTACAGWLSPIDGSVRIEATITHAHPECGNGVEWTLELRRGGNRQRLAGGVAHGGMVGTVAPIGPLPVRRGDLVSIVIGPRNHDHSCDLTDLELVIHSTGSEPREWSLTRDVADDVLAGNPHADRFGNPGVWHFYSEPVTAADGVPVLPPGSLLARWQVTDDSAERRRLAEAVRKLLVSGPPAGADSPDAVLYRQLSSLGGPLMLRAWKQVAAAVRPAAGPGNGLGLDPVLFGKHPNGSAIDPTSLCVQAPSVLEVRIPAALAAGAELVTTAALDPKAGAAGSVQMQALTSPPPPGRLVADAPVLTAENGAAWHHFEQAFDDFRAVFPAALCYTKIVPVDEVVTMTLFYREDGPLRRLMLSDAEARELDRLWNELQFVSQWPLKLVNGYEQIREFATQDRPDLAEPLRKLKKPIYDGAAAFTQTMLDAEPRQVDKLIEFAGRAYRRPLTAAENSELRALYAKLRGEGLPHEEAFRLTLARIFVSPAFLYRLESAPESAPRGAPAAPISDWELANRLSYFLWSSQPDEPLRTAAAAGILHQPKVLAAQTRRMLADPRMRRLATQFACQWLHIYEFDTLDEKSEKYFPEFAALRGDMYEESIRFFTDLFRNDRSVLSIFDADHTFVNERLAGFYGIPLTTFYGIPGVEGDDWRRVDGMRARGRGGILGLSATLAEQSGASRTSPILRGAWVSEVLLGEKLPAPPKDVPRLPEDETATEGLTVRQLVAKHTSNPKCAGCHRKIDPFGFSLEGFDAIGRARLADLANRPINTKTRTPDGKEIDGLAGLRDYLLRTRRPEILRQFCRKLLGYALGRAVQLSDEPLLTEIQQKLARNDYRFSVAIEAIVQSRQFRDIRASGASPTEGASTEIGAGSSPSGGPSQPRALARSIRRRIPPGSADRKSRTSKS